MYTTADCEKLYDEVKDLYSDDMREKNSTKRSAKSYSHRRRGKVHFSSDYLSNKELKSLNGEVKTYQIGKHMIWPEFDILPGEIQNLYVKRLRDLYGATNGMISEMLGVPRDFLVKYMVENKISILENKNRVPDVESWHVFLNTTD